MHSRDHAIVSILVGSLGAAGLSVPVPDPVAVGYAVILGVAIDLDHFLLARVRTGHWNALQRCLREPRIALFDQSEIFRTGVVGRNRRLLSHLVIGTLLVAVLWPIDAAVSAFTALVVSAHIVSDLVSDAVKQRKRHESGSIRSRRHDSVFRK